MDSTAPSELLQQPVAAPPLPVRVLIPSSSSDLLVEPSAVTPQPESSEEEGDEEYVPTYTSSQRNICGSKAKVGRWTEEEHLVFLDGLKTYGKQWKTIAGMIGTRTVVQVRTHAQKYFQKMERQGTSTNLPARKPPRVQAPSPSSKRKSSSASQPTRKKSRKPSPRLSLSLRSSAKSTEQAPPNKEPPQASQLSSYPSYVSKSSSSGSDSGDNWSISPNTVAAEIVDLHQIALQQPAAEQFDFSEDPLQWLVDTDTHQYLPESSLPIFPELLKDDDKLVTEAMVEEAISTVMAETEPSVADPEVEETLFLPGSNVAEL